MDKEKAKDDARIAAGLKIPFILSESQADLFRNAFNGGFDAGYAAALSTSSGWVSVSERLPEKEGNYLVTINTAYNSERRSIWVDVQGFAEGEFETLDIAAWMPIPPFTVEENKV